MTGCVNGQGPQEGQGTGRGKKSKVAGLDATAASDKGVPEPVDFADALRVGAGFILADCDPRSTPGLRRRQGRRRGGPRGLAGRRDQPVPGAAVCRVQGRGEALPAARGAGDGHLGQGRHHAPRRGPDGPAGREVHRVQGADRPRSASTPSSGGSATPCRAPGRSGSSTGRSTRTSSSCACTTWCRRATWSRRYAQINDFEAKAGRRRHDDRQGLLNISSDEQKARLTERLERADKHWKYNPGDVDERLLWPEYQEAYQAVFEKTSTDGGAVVRGPGRPQVVRPPGRPEPRPRAPRGAWTRSGRPADFDVEAEKQRLAAT